MLDLKLPPDAVALLAIAFMWVLSRVLPVGGGPWPVRGILAAVLLTVGFAFVAAARVALARARTTFSPVAPQRTESLVTHGVYRVSRNPMYVGMTAALLGVAALFGAIACAIPAVLFAAWVARFQIAPEERALREKFGDAYDAYAASTRRWL